MMRMHAVVPRQHYELADHPAFRVARNCAEHRVGPGLVELIGRCFGHSRRNVKMHPVLLSVRGLHDERVLGAPRVLELEASRYPSLHFDTLRLEAKPVERLDMNGCLRRCVHDTRWPLHMRVGSVSAPRR